MNYILDTHVLVWRFVEPRKLSKKVALLLKNPEHVFLVPAVAVLEVQYLVEVGKIDLRTPDIIQALSQEPNYQTIPFDAPALLQSIQLTSNRDPFDRMILSHALALATKIITKDQWMRKTAPHLAVF